MTTSASATSNAPAFSWRYFAREFLSPALAVFFGVNAAYLLAQWLFAPVPAGAGLDPIFFPRVHALLELYPTVAVGSLAGFLVWLAIGVVLTRRRQQALRAGSGGA